MSTQLIVYPQIHDGTYNSTFTASTNNIIVNGETFIGLNSTADYASPGSPNMYEDVIVNAEPTVVGLWYRFHSIVGAGGFPYNDPPTVASNNLVLPTGTGNTGVYQLLQTVPGIIYDVTVTVSQASSGVMIIHHLSGASSGGYYDYGSWTLGTTTQTISFTAVTTNDIFMIYGASNGAGADLIIESIAIEEQGATAGGVYTNLYDGQVICDLYEEEDIPLTLSIDDFKNVAEQVKSYSKDFNLPATKRNNQIFNNMFEVTRADDGLIFNPYVKTQCTLKQDGFILFEGYLRMIDIKDNEGEISYNVNLYSEVVALADTLKEVTFADLSFTELEHAYNISNITDSWNDSGTGLTYLNPSTSGFRDAYSTVKYPNIDWNHQFYPDASGNPILSNLESMFRPCIQLKYLINKIFASTSFNWTSNFFDSADFGKLYMDFNWGSNDLGLPVTGGQYGGNNTSLNFLSTTSFAALPLDYTTYDPAMGWDSVNYRFVATYNYQAYLMEVPHFSPVFYSTQTMETRWARYNSAGVLLDTFNYQSQVLYTTPPTTTTPLTTMILQAGDYLQYEWKTNTAGQALLGQNQLLIILVSIGSAHVTSTTLLETLRGELGQWDFLKGIMTMFNLVSMVDESNPNNILIEPYSDIFINNTAGTSLAARSIQHDWTDKVDVSQMELMPLTDLNKDTVFKFVEDEDDHVFNSYKNTTSGHLYGSYKELSSTFATNNMPTVLQGTKEIIAEPFAATVSKQLMSQYSDFVVPSIYAMADLSTAEGFDNSPRVLYNNGKKVLTSCTYNIPAQNGSLAVPLATTILQFSHLSTIPSVSATTTDFVFQSEQLYPGVGFAPTDNLYSTYWQPYFNELYNADTRTMTLKVNLTPSDIANFKFFDVVFIKNRSFRVNKIEYKPNSLATVEFILIP